MKYCRITILGYTIITIYEVPTRRRTIETWALGTRSGSRKFVKMAAVPSSGTQCYANFVIEMTVNLSLNTEREGVKLYLLVTHV